MGAVERIRRALFLVPTPKLPIQIGVARTKVLDCAFSLLLEVGLAAVDEVEAAGDFTRDLDVRDLVFAHRNVHWPVQQDVRALQQRVTEKSVSRQIALFELLLLILVGRYTLEPAERRDHRQQQVQLSVLRNARLYKERRDRGVETGGEPVDNDRPRIALDRGRILVARRQRVVVGDEEVAVVLVLKLRPVLERAVVVSEVQAAGRAHAGKDPARRGCCRAQRQVLRMVDASMDDGSTSYR
jgi:hypothetical protein